MRYARGKVDVLTRNTTWSLSRDLGSEITFVGVFYHEGQGFMVHRDTSTLSARELSKKTVCAAGISGPQNVRVYFTRNHMELGLKEFLDTPAAVNAYLAGACYALAADPFQFYAMRAGLASEDAHRILPEVISKEPLSPAVRTGDGRWFDIVRWTLFTLINAEEAGVDSCNVEAARALMPTTFSSFWTWTVRPASCSGSARLELSDHQPGRKLRGDL